MSLLRRLSAELSVGCRFCGGLGDLLVAPAVWEYTTDRKYHAACLAEVLAHPEREAPLLVDLAIDIEERLASIRKDREEQIERARKSADRLAAGRIK